MFDYIKLARCSSSLVNTSDEKSARGRRALRGSRPGGVLLPHGGDRESNPRRRVQEIDCDTGDRQKQGLMGRSSREEMGRCGDEDIDAELHACEGEVAE